MPENIFNPTEADSMSIDNAMKSPMAKAMLTELKRMSRKRKASSVGKRKAPVVKRKREPLKKIQKKVGMKAVSKGRSRSRRNKEKKVMRK